MDLSDTLILLGKLLYKQASGAPGEPGAPEA